MQRRPGANQRNDAINISEHSPKASTDVEPANRRQPAQMNQLHKPAITANKSQESQNARKMACKVSGAVW